MKKITRDFIYPLLFLGCVIGFVWYALDSWERAIISETQEQIVSERLDSLKAIGDGVCLVSWYGEDYHGRVTANGEIYNMHDLTFAHRTLPFGTLARFSYNGKSKVGRCNDRGPYCNNREFDISRALADSLGLTEKGVDVVHVEIITERIMNVNK